MRESQDVKLWRSLSMSLGNLVQVFQEKNKTPAT